MKYATRTILIIYCLALAGLSTACKKSDPPERPSAEATQPAQPSADPTPSAEPTPSAAKTKEAPGASPTSLDELPEGVNAAQNEMRLLNTSMQTILTLIANDQLGSVEAEIKKVHPARKLTVEAIQKGLYEPPQNADKMEEFEALDDKFHQNLKGLLKASKKDDLKLAAKKYGDLVQGCAECHTKFRFE